MAQSIEITMGRYIDESIKFAAMQTYGQRVRAAREHAKLSQEQLGKALGGLKQPSILAIEKRDTKSKYTLEIARITGVRAEWLEAGKGGMIADKVSDAPLSRAGEKPLTSPDLNIQQYPSDVPVLGLASCGSDGLFYMNGQIHDHVKRPPRLAGVKDAYALYVDGYSMSPWREPGELVYVHPTMPVKIGDYVVVEMMPEGADNDRKAYIKRLVRRTAEKVVLVQYNPPEEKTLPAKRVRAIHRVMGWSEILGL